MSPKAVRRWWARTPPFALAVVLVVLVLGVGSLVAALVLLLLEG